MLRNLDLKIIYSVWVLVVASSIIFLPLLSGAEGDYLDSFSVAGEGIADPATIAANNEFIWVGAYSADLIYKYFGNGTYTGISWTNDGSPPYMYGMAYYDGFIWICDDVSDTVYKYFDNGTYAGVDWSVHAGCVAGCPEAIAFDGTYVRISDSTNDVIYKYFPNGTYTGDSFDYTPSGLSNVWGMSYFNGYFYMNDLYGSNFSKFYENGTYISGFDFTAANANAWGSASNGTFVWSMDRTDDAVYRYEGPGVPPVDTCTCPGAGNNWEIDMSDYCNITEACDLTTGTLNFTGAGVTRCNASVDTTNLGDPGASGVLYIQDSCLITID